MLSLRLSLSDRKLFIMHAAEASAAAFFMPAVYMQDICSQPFKAINSINMRHQTQC